MMVGQTIKFTKQGFISYWGTSIAILISGLSEPLTRLHMSRREAALQSWGVKTQPISTTLPQRCQPQLGGKWDRSQLLPEQNTSLLWVTLHLLRTSNNPVSEWVKYTPALSLAWSKEVFCLPEKGKGCAHDSARESFWATQNSTANSCFQFITSVSSWITNTATRTLQMSFPNKNSQQQKKTIKKKNWKLCSLQSWYIPPNSENTWSPNHKLWQHLCPSKRICAIDPQSFDQILYPKDVLAVLKEIWKS